MKCPKCEKDVLHKAHNGNDLSLRVDGVIRIDDMGRSHAKCYFCKSEFQLPLRMTDYERARTRYVLKSTHRG